MRIAIVVLRYGEGIAGGAESLARGFAEEAARRGWEIEVWSTCAQNHYTWENSYPAGRSQVNGVTVHRFPVYLLNQARQGRIEGQLAARAALATPAQYAWLEGGAQSPALYEHVARHAADFDALIVLPYAMPLMNMAAWAAPERVIMWPCLHDEPYAYLEPVRLLLESAWAVMFNTPEERDLATQQLKIVPRRHAVAGVGVNLATRYRAPSAPPQDLLYAGRLEGGKNLSLLYEYMHRYASEGGTARLVVVGKGPLTPPAHPAFVYRGFVSEAEKAAACASALALCQPSLNESFSLTTMEAWLAGRPALVHADSPVTRGHVERSRGGLFFRAYDEFKGALQWLQANPALAARMGQNGRRYVEENYTWPVVVDRFERAVRAWQGHPLTVMEEGQG